MKRYLFLLLSTILSGFACFGQDFRSGYIIQHQGDTLTGEIAYQSHSKYFESCLFKRDGIQKQFFSNDIIGYGFDDGRYFASGINKDKFVEAHIIGFLSLYQSDTTFFLKKGAEVHELKARNVEMEIDGRKGIMEDTKWKGIVSYLISDCIQNPMGRMETMKMQIKTLSKLVVEYNKCNGSTFINYGGTERRMKIDFGMTIGYNLSNISINNDSEDSRQYYNGFADNYLSQDPTIGIIWQIFFPRFSERLGVQAEAIYAKSSYQGYGSYQISSDNYYHDTFISIGTISVPIALKYNLPLGRKNMVFFNLGINNDIMTKKESLMTHEKLDSQNRVIVSEDTEMFKIRSVQGGLFSGIGFSRSIGSIDVGLTYRFLYSFQLDDDSGLTATNSKSNFSIFFLIK